MTFTAVWDAIIKEVRGSDEEPKGRFFSREFPYGDPNAYPDNDLRIRRPTDDGSGDYLGYYTHRDGKAYTFLEPFAQGSGWRPLPTDVKFESAKFDENAPDPWLRDKRGNRVPALSPQRDRVLGMDIMDTAMHEGGHQATHQEIDDAIDQAKHAIAGKTTWSSDSYGQRDGQTEDPLYPRGLRNQQVRAFTDKVGEGENRSREYEYESLAGLLLDNPQAMKEWLKGTDQMNALSLSAFNNPEMQLDSSGHEKAAYTVEYPNHPGYAAGKWLMHTSVPQAMKRKYLLAIERAQKAAGVKEPIAGDGIARQISPNLGFGRRTAVLREIMGNPPENRDAPESKRLLMPAKERIQQNMINAAIGQAYGILAQSGDFRMHPIAGRVEQHGERVKQAKNFAKPLIDAIKRHFKTSDGQGESLKDLPEDLRMELGRMQLRQHLANMVAQQFEMEADRENDPRKLWDEYQIADKVNERMMEKHGPMPMRYDIWDHSHMSEDERDEANIPYHRWFEERVNEEVAVIDEMMNSGPFTTWDSNGKSPYLENRYDYSDDPRDNAIEIPYEYRSSFREWAERKGVDLHHWGGDEYVKLKGPVKRTTPMKRIPKPKFEYDPVSRAIADAFMLSEYDVKGEGRYSSSDAPTLDGRILQPNVQGKKWGGELFSGEVAPMRGHKGISPWHRNLTDSTDENITSLREYMKKNTRRIGLNDLLAGIAQERLEEVQRQKRERGED